MSKTKEEERYWQEEELKAIGQEEEYEGIEELQFLKEGDKVQNQDGLRGTVHQNNVNAQPNAPFNVLDNKAVWHTFIGPTGDAVLNRDYWRLITIEGEVDKN